MDENPSGGTPPAAQIGLSEADLEFWARLPGWSVREQAALLLGLDPEDKATLDESREFKRYLLMMRRVKAVKQLRSFPRPRIVLRWARSNNIPVPHELRNAVTGGKPLINWRRRYLELKARTEAPDEDNLPPKTRKSLEIILLAVARRNYGYLPDRNNSAAKMIAADATLKGVVIMEDTVRDRLREAHDNCGHLFEAKKDDA
ncbi:hypothetical protein [Lichenihabitans psoromatis]|uniref:hypothetical protein n=1 Tax=Lichenihabitans psoromatis TaxID=2528642 RepID=UPI00103850BA|nr:hypothetical protein [Lichenihabitans psoromatis]